MHTAVVSSVAEMKAAFAEAKTKGLGWAAVSNTGLKPGRWRLTFIPESAFVTTPNMDTAAQAVEQVMTK